MTTQWQNFNHKIGTEPTCLDLNTLRRRPREVTLGRHFGLIVKYTILHRQVSAKRYIAQITPFNSLVIISAMMAVYEIPNEVLGVFYV